MYIYITIKKDHLGLWNFEDGMNREGKLSLIIFINLRGMKSSNKKGNQSLISCQKVRFLQDIYNFVL